MYSQQRRPHRLRVGLPPTGRTLNIGEQKRHDTRRRDHRGHPHRMSQGSGLTSNIVGSGPVAGNPCFASKFHRHADVASDACLSRARLRFASSTRIVVMCRMIEMGTR